MSMTSETEAIYQADGTTNRQQGLEVIGQSYWNGFSYSNAQSFSPQEYTRERAPLSHKIILRINIRPQENQLEKKSLWLTYRFNNVQILSRRRPTLVLVEFACPTNQPTNHIQLLYQAQTQATTVFLVASPLSFST